MPVKIAKSAPRPSFGLPELLVAIHTSRQSCYKAGKSANIHASSGVIRGIPVEIELVAHAALHNQPRSAARSTLIASTTTPMTTMNRSACIIAPAFSLPDMPPSLGRIRPIPPA